MRILSLDPAATELVFALGAGNALVGRTDECVYPDAARSVPAIGLDGVQQAVAIFDPDLLAIGRTHEDARNAFGPGRAIFSLTPIDAESLLQQITDLGWRLDKPIETDMVTHELRSVLERVKQRTAHFRELRVYIEQERPEVADAFLHDLVRIAGGTPFEGPREQVARFNPQAIVIVSADNRSEELILARDGWRELCAAKTERIYTIEPDLLRPTPRLAVGIKLLAKLLRGVEINGE